MSLVTGTSACDALSLIAAAASVGACRASRSSRRAALSYSACTRFLRPPTALPPKALTATCDDTTLTFTYMLRPPRRASPRLSSCPPLDARALQDGEQPGEHTPSTGTDDPQSGATAAEGN